MMGRVLRVLQGAAGAVALAACFNGLAQEAAKKFPPEQIKRGAELYALNCESCHGVGMVGPQWGIDLATFPRDNPNRFVNSVTEGVRAMPPWGDVLKPEDIQALWSYVVAGEPRR